MAYEMYNQKETIRDALEECNKNNFSIGSTLKNRQTTISSLEEEPSLIEQYETGDL